MDVETVAKRIRELINPDSSEYKLAAAKHYHEKAIDNTWLAVDLADELIPLLADQTEFKSEPTRMLHKGICSSSFSAPQAARRLIFDALGGEPIESLIEKLIVLLRTTSADGHIYLALWGVQIREEVKLHDGTRCLPFLSLPPSFIKTTITQDFTPKGLPTTIFSRVGFPNTVLAKPLVTEPLFAPSGTVQPPWEQYSFVKSSLLSTAIALTAVGPCAPIPSVTWYSFDDPMLEHINGANFLEPQTFEILPRPGSTDTEVEPNEVSEIVSAILRLSGNSKSKIEIALSRLNQSLRRHDIGDKALDLGIAFESLLVNHGGENTFKVHTRTALLYPGSDVQKLRARAIAKALYNLRSIVAHQGKCPDRESVKDYGKERSADIVAEATAICTALIREIARRGGLPDWNLCDLDSTKGWPI